MKHTIKLLTLAAILTAVFGLTGCPGPVNNYIEPPVHEHVFGDWGDWEVETAATCTEDGSKKRTRTCSCGEVEEETAVITALGHDWVLESDTATCTEDGVKTYKCSRCNETRTEDSPAHHHVDYETSGYCETCRKYKYPNTKLEIKVFTSEPNYNAFLKNVLGIGLSDTCIIGNENKYETVKYSFDLNGDNGKEMSVEELLSLKNNYKNKIVVEYVDKGKTPKTDPSIKIDIYSIKSILVRQ